MYTITVMQDKFPLSSSRIVILLLLLGLIFNC